MTDETSDCFAEEDVDDDNMSCGIWMTNYFSDLRDVAFSNFLTLDTDLATESANTEQEAAKEALKAAQPQPTSAEEGVMLLMTAALTTMLKKCVPYRRPLRMCERYGTFW